LDFFEVDFFLGLGVGFTSSSDFVVNAESADEGRGSSDDSAV